MGTNPFQDLPQSSFRKRLIGPLLGVLLVALPITGELANSNWMLDLDRRPAQITPGSGSLSLQGSSSINVARKHFLRTLSYWLLLPEMCVSGNTVNSLQKEHCVAYQQRLFGATLICLVPFAALLIFWLVAHDQIKGFYRRARKRVEAGNALCAGTVTDPPELSRDAFAWLFCLRLISIQLDRGKQTKIYVPEDAPRPRPGQTYAVYDAGSILGQKRRVGTLYAPHMAIMAGSRRKT